MTNLTRPVKRITAGRIGGRNLVVIIEPPDLLTIREKGRRKGYTVSIEGLYWSLAKREADDRKRKRRQNRRKGKVK